MRDFGGDFAESREKSGGIGEEERGLERRGEKGGKGGEESGGAKEGREGKRGRGKVWLS